MHPDISALGQSLNNWQTIYLVSILIALLSTCAIVYFAFHRHHAGALRTSNYLYLMASVLAVIATVVLVVKTRSLDSEKDRILKLSSDAADLKIAEANATAASANQGAEKARVDAETARLTANHVSLRVKQSEIARLKLQVIVGQQEAELSNLRENGLPRKLDEQQAQLIRTDLINFLQRHPLSSGFRVPVQVFGFDFETVSFASKVAAVIASSGLSAERLPVGDKKVATGTAVVVHSLELNEMPPLVAVLAVALTKAGF